jgi:hypothetical protein
MPARIVDAELDRRKRALRLQIGRLRRRIDGRVRSSTAGARRLVSWRTYVRSYPGPAVLAALGTGLALSAGLSTRRLSRWLGLRLVRRAADQAGRLLWRELKQVWNDSTPATTAETDHDPS